MSGFHWLADARLIVIVVLFLAGCGSDSDKPETGTVNGVVTLDGEPLSGARIVFSPVDGGQSSEATTKEDGSYELIYRGDEMGAKVGKHEVFITTYEEPYLDDSGKEVGGEEEKVPERYNTNTELTVEVKPGGNELPFDLE